MTTAEQKATKICAELFGLPMNSGYLWDAIVKALKEHGRDVRHACAEAVLSLPHCTTAHNNAIHNSDGELAWKVIDADQAHAACMNVTEG